MSQQLEKRIRRWFADLDSADWLRAQKAYKYLLFQVDAPFLPHLLQRLDGTDTVKLVQAVHILAATRRRGIIDRLNLLLLPHLTDADASIRRAVLQALSPHEGDDLIPLATGMLRDPDPDVRWAAARLLDAARDPRTVLVFLDLLTSAEYWLRSTAIDALGHLRDARAVEPLCAQLSDGAQQHTILRVLVEIGDLRAVGCIRPMLASPNPNIRMSAVWALGELRAGELWPEIVRQFDTPNVMLRCRVVEALGTIGLPEVVAHLIGCLADPHRAVRRKAVVALGRIGDPQASAPIVGCLADPYHRVRLAAIAALGHVGDAAAIVALTELLVCGDMFSKQNKRTIQQSITDITVRTRADSDSV